MAVSYGRHHFKCPMCQDTSKQAFTQEAEKIGVYIPVKDADWEKPENEDFYHHSEMNEAYSQCDAETCYCNKGRKYQLQGSR